MRTTAFSRSSTSFNPCFSANDKPPRTVFNGADKLARRFGCTFCRGDHWSAPRGAAGRLTQYFGRTRSNLIVRGIPYAPTADGLWFTGCSGTKENGQGAIPLVGKKKMPYKHSGGEHTDSIARRRRAKRGLFEKSPLLNPAKTFGQLVPSVRRVHPRQRVSLSAAPQVPQAATGAKLLACF